MVSLLIAGSRHASAKLLNSIQVAIDVAKQEHFDIIVGDNPLGVDVRAIHLALKAELKVTIYGIHPKPRVDVPLYPIMENVFYERVLYIPERDDDPLWEWKAYRMRDREMCHASAQGYFYWNGVSQGTKVGYEYLTLTLHKPAFIIQCMGQEKVVRKNGELPPRKL